MELFPLGQTKTIIEQVGLDITWVWEDLVFVEHNPFLIRFDPKSPRHLHIHFNTECEAAAVTKLKSALQNAAKEEGLRLSVDEKFTLRPKEGGEKEEFDVVFQAKSGS